jgi:putative glutamine amidotransferase
VRVNEAYTKALVAAGLLPVIVPPVSAEVAVRMLDGFRGLVLTGGEDVSPKRFGAEPHPATGHANDRRDEYELALAEAARERGVPTLAICRGIQVVNVAFGGTLVQDIPSERPRSLPHDPPGPRSGRVHAVSIVPGSCLAGALGDDHVTANSTHHQALGEIGSGILVTAHAPDGIVEGIESSDPGWWMVGVQWHPEELTETTEDWDRRLFAAFAARVRVGERERKGTLRSA